MRQWRSIRLRDHDPSDGEEVSPCLSFSKQFREYVFSEPSFRCDPFSETGNLHSPGPMLPGRPGVLTVKQEEQAV